MTFYHFAFTGAYVEPPQTCEEAAEPELGVGAVQYTWRAGTMQFKSLETWGRRYWNGTRARVWFWYNTTLNKTAVCVDGRWSMELERDCSNSGSNPSSTRVFKAEKFRKFCGIFNTNVEVFFNGK